MLSLWAILGNLWVAFGGLFKKRKQFQSFVPLIGGILGVVGVMLLPIPRWHIFWWLPLFIDLGCVPLLLAAAIEYLRKKIAKP